MTIETKSETTINGLPVVNTSKIKEILGFGLSSRFIEEELEIEPAAKTTNSVLWYEKDLPYLFHQLSQHAFNVAWRMTNVEHN